MKKEAVLDKAKELVSNERLKHYGPPIVNFTRIAKLWSVVLGKEITAALVAVCLAQLKISRLCETPDHEDSWVDLAGYAACGGEVAEKQDNTVKLANVQYTHLYGQVCHINPMTLHHSCNQPHQYTPQSYGEYK